MEGWIAGALFFVLAVPAMPGCTKTIGLASPPPCPQFGEETILEYERLLEAEDDGRVTPELDRLHEWIERMTVYCIAIDEFREDRH